MSTFRNRRITFVERWCGVVRGDWLTGQAAHSTPGTIHLILMATQQLTVHKLHSAPTVYDRTCCRSVESSA